MLKRILDIIENKEHQRSEFKENFGKEVMKTICSFSNSIGGTILIGVSNDGTIKGVNADAEIIKDWMDRIKLGTQPQLFPAMNLIKFENKTVVEITVQEFPVKPVSCKGRYYKRIGASNHLVPLNEIIEMQSSSFNSSFDSFSVNESVDDLFSDVIASYFHEVKSRGRIELSDNNLLNLEKPGFIRKGKATFAALLLFGEHHTGIHIGRFRAPDVIIDDILIKSPLVNAIDDAMTFIKKNISVTFEFTNDTRRVEKWQYPLPVIRELLLHPVR
ncbi:MAG: putative DNA binding domain-containing protein [Candidatus Marinimicrobia bacterium]|nr:putative DNA binding domain-containing protein [bacterium]MCG2716331.1 putative DNA binding domain-containing protein [Candidatus Neomarinimicrobiota bacterium]